MKPRQSLALYLLSFAMLGIYWNNHNHLLHASTHVNGTVLWANLHLLFWLSLVPFATRWIGESGPASLPTALYGGALLLSAIAYTVLVRALLAWQPPHSVLATEFSQSCQTLRELHTGIVVTALGQSDVA